MPDSLALAWLMLPLGAALGWYLARRWPRPHEQETRGSSEYLTGLTHLVDQDPDQAIAAFVRAVEVDDETVELHLTLGSLFRKRGEVDRALRIHENLLARPNLKPLYRNQARFALAQDFLKAGMIDRAETLFKELVAQGMFLQTSLENLVALYEQVRDWRQALEAARQLEAVKSSSLRPLIGQYYCELSEAARAGKDLPEALRLAGRALSEHPDCVRASLLQGALHEAGGDFVAAIKSYRRVPEQDPRFIGESIEPLRRCHQALGNRAAYSALLEEAEELWHHPSVVLARAQLMRDEGADPSGYLTERLQQQPQWRGLDLLLQAVGTRAGEAAPLVDGLRQAMVKVMERRPAYRCVHCGFAPTLLFWQCPSCKQWTTITPLDELAAAKP
ncbi:MAG: lipopolysaccharide assembly protein LapB [Gammaproteobacteria bacterium]